MKTLLYDTQTRQITFKSYRGTVNMPNPSLPVITSENSVQFPFECILGVIKLDSFSKYLFFCSESEKLGKFNDSEIFKVIKVDYVAITDDTNKEIADSIVNLFESLNFYYSVDSQDEHFLWNGEMLKNFKEWACVPYKDIKVHNTNNRNPFSSKYKENNSLDNIERLVIGNLICGYFETRIVREQDTSYNLTIFSRISVKKIGTRLLSRGVDENGKVSFFVETKFITATDDYKNEFTILRGSVPVFWSQDDPLKPHKIKFEQDYQKNKDAFIKHFKGLQEGYGKIVVVDLLGTKKYERILSQLYRDLCKENGIDYIHFDLNRFAEDIESIKCILYNKIFEYIKNYKMEILNELDKNTGSVSNSNTSKHSKANLNSLKIQTTSFIKPNSDSSSFESEENDWDDEIQPVCNDLDSLSLINREEDAKDIKITFRVNCMDCLDRTNIGEYIIFKYFNNLKFQVIKNMWVNNGNALSNMYTGSNSLKTELPSRGKLSVMGKVSDFVISANRMIQNKFIDKDKQAIIDLVLGRKSN